MVIMFPLQETCLSGNIQPMQEEGWCSEREKHLTGLWKEKCPSLLGHLAWNSQTLY